jgi:hypothetical protein
MILIQTYYYCVSMSDRLGVKSPRPHTALPERRFWRERHVSAVPQSLPVRCTKNKAAWETGILLSVDFQVAIFESLTVDTRRDYAALLPQTPLYPLFLATGCPE